MKILLNNPLIYVYVNPNNFFFTIQLYIVSLNYVSFFELQLHPWTPLGALTACPQTPQLLWWSIRDAQSPAT